MLQNPPAPGILDLDQDERWLTIHRIVTSQHFRKSPRLSQLLLYLSEQTLLGRTDLLTEHTIATRVFDREAGFDPGVDTIVRSHMVRLRQKLEQYTEDAGPAASMQVSVPRGEYLVRFHRLAPPPTAPQTVEPPPFSSPSVRAPTLHPTKETTRPWFLVSCMLGILVLVLAVVLLTVLTRSSARAKTSAPPLHPLWSRLFLPHQSTIFVAADSGLVLLHGLSGRDVTLAQYLARDFTEQSRGLPPERVREMLTLAGRRYTSFVDLDLFRRLETLPFATPGSLVLKYARDLHMDDLKQGNILLSGSRGANPWLELYEPGMNFINQTDEAHHRAYFLNRHPLPGEPSEFSVTETDPQRRTLGVLAFLQNLEGSGNALIMEGSSVAGTESISDFLFEDRALLAFLARIKKPDGTLPHFEVLIESNTVSGSAGPFHILAYRTHP